MNDFEADKYWRIANDGLADEEGGNVYDYGVWFARIGNVILTEDDYGNRETIVFPNEEAAREEFAEEAETWLDYEEYN